MPKFPGPTLPCALRAFRDARSVQNNFRTIDVIRASKRLPQTGTQNIRRNVIRKAVAHTARRPTNAQKSNRKDKSQMKLSDKNSKKAPVTDGASNAAEQRGEKKRHGPFITSVLEHKLLAIRCAVYLLLAVICYYVQYAISVSDSYTQLRYLRQLFGFAAIVLLVLFLTALKRLTPRGLIISGIRAFGRATGITAALEAVVRGLHKLFGIPDRERIAGKDSKSFVFRRGERHRKALAKNTADRRKWRDMTTPAEQLRYIYIKLMKAKIRDGYIYDPVRTPREHGKLLGDGAATDGFISRYCDARYSGGTVPVDETDVERALPLVSKNGKIS